MTRSRRYLPLVKMEETTDVICRFCQQTALNIPIKVLDRIGVRHHWCETCQAEYLRFEDSDTINSCTLYTTIKDKCYCWATTGTGRAALWYVENPGELGKEISRDREVLFSLAPRDNQPTITPENVNQKIKTMLVFL